MNRQYGILQDWSTMMKLIMENSINLDLILYCVKASGTESLGVKIPRYDGAL